MSRLPHLAFSVLALALVAGGGTAWAASGKVRAEVRAAQVYEKTSGSLVLVRGRTGAGSGFVVREGEAAWLYTNEHVLRCGGPIGAYFVDGRKVKVEGEVEIAENRDVARVRVAAGTPALTIAAGAPSLDAEVFVFGNSDGEGVMTKLVGKVLGVGDDRIEVNAKFVQGNSGSAILNAQGEVLGIATEASHNCEPENWVKADTRFNAVRRYGERLGGIVWKRIDWEAYEKACRVLAAYDVYRRFLIPVCFGKRQLVTDYDIRDAAGARGVSSLRSALNAIVRQDAKYRKAYAEVESLLEKRKTLQKGSMQYPKNETVNIRYRKLKHELQASIAVRKDAFRKAFAALKGTEWPCVRLKRDADRFCDGFRYCADAYEKFCDDSLSELDWKEP